MYPGNRSRDGQLLRGREPSSEHLAKCRLQLLERRQQTWAWRQCVSAERLARSGPRAEHKEGGQWAEAGRRADSARGGQCGGLCWT